MCVRQFLEALWKHWWALMSSAVLSLISVYAARQHKTNSWVFSVSCVAAVLMFFVAAFRAWNEQHIKLEGALAKIADIESENRRVEKRRALAELEKLEEENRRVAARRASEDLDNRLLALIKESLSEMRKQNEIHSNMQAYTAEFFIAAAKQLGVAEDEIRDSMRHLKAANRIPGLADIILVSPWSRL